jgi:large subunit ribosomal protein L9
LIAFDDDKHPVPAPARAVFEENSLMKVLLKEDVYNLGYAGEVHMVADGYGRNFLLPKGLAVKATPQVMKQAEVWRKQADARREELRAEYDALSDRIRAVTLTFTARAGDTGKLYGSITTSQIADDLNETLGTDIDRRKVGTDQIRQLGEHLVVVRLDADHQPEFTVVVHPEGGSPAAAAAAAEIAAEAAQLAAEATGTAVEAPAYDADYEDDAYDEEE